MKQRYKRYIIIFMALAFCFAFAACGNKAEDNTSATTSDNQLTAVATLFPQYDFARIVGGDKVEVIKLLPNGVESHSYEPAPNDVVTINEADFFIYTGSAMEPWAATIIDGVNSDNLTVVDVSQNVPLLEEGSGGHHMEGETDHGHYGVDPHIWTDPTRAMIMVDNIAAAFAAQDPQNADYYQGNAAAYKEKLTALDGEIQEIVASGQRQKIIFGGRFAFAYFCQHYGLDHDAAYDSCAEGGEPSARKVAALMDEIKNEGIPVIYYEELRQPTVAQSIADDTGAEMLLLHSCHNVTDAEIEEGVSYLSLMQQNAANLKKGLN